MIFKDQTDSLAYRLFDASGLSLTEVQLIDEGVSALNYPNVFVLNGVDVYLSYLREVENVGSYSNNLVLRSVLEDGTLGVSMVLKSDVQSYHGVGLTEGGLMIASIESGEVVMNRFDNALVLSESNVISTGSKVIVSELDSGMFRFVWLDEGIDGSGLAVLMGVK